MIAGPPIIVEDTNKVIIKQEEESNIIKIQKPIIDPSQSLDTIKIMSNTAKPAKALRSTKPTTFQMISYEKGSSKESHSESSSSKSSSKSETPDELTRGIKRKVSEVQQIRATRRTRSSPEEMIDAIIVSSGTQTPEQRRTKHSSKRTSVLRPSLGMTRTSPEASPMGERLVVAGFGRPTNTRSSNTSKHPPISNLRMQLRRSNFTDSSVPARRLGMSTIVQPFDENQENYDDLRVQAISKLSRLHAAYISCSKDWTKNYRRYQNEYDEICRWRAEHKLKPVYIDVIHINGHSDIDENTVLERIPDTEYLVGTNQWDYESAYELLMNVNRGSYLFESELLRPVREGRKNVRSRPRSPNEETPINRPFIKVLSAKPQGSQRLEKSKILDWHCAGYDANGEKCNFVVDNAISDYGRKAVSKHWNTCPKRRFQSQQLLHGKKITVQKAHLTLKELQEIDPLNGIE